jgi:hypothetical protein
MLKSVITVVNTGGYSEAIIGNGFSVLCQGHATTQFSIDSTLAADAVTKINAASSLLTATAGTPTDDGEPPNPVDHIPYSQRGAVGGVAALDANCHAALAGIGLTVKENGTVPDAADDDAIAETQNVAGPGDLTLDGADISDGAATFDVPRKVTIYSADDMSAKTLTVVGTDENGDPQTEEITGPGAAATVTSTGWFKTVTQVSIDAAGTNLKVGKGAGRVILDLAGGNVQKLKILADATIDFENWKASGTMDSLLLRLDNTDNKAITWGVDNWAGGSAPSFASDDVDLLNIYTMDGGTIVEGVFVGTNLS